MLGFFEKEGHSTLQCETGLQMAKEKKHINRGMRVPFGTLSSALYTCIGKTWLFDPAGSIVKDHRHYSTDRSDIRHESIHQSHICLLEPSGKVFRGLNTESDHIAVGIQEKNSSKRQKNNLH
ncbi:hypothetical protein JK207_05615 [Gluconobacter cerinus]|uniref:hypothetical protein n=1 Tax=Gluconobacter TaxID=441 RepID=UPI001B8C873A|nr:MULTISPECIES: hypothetical protein [Gluconobacter]MBS0993197.1 hypothetical protein [Gluconobacter cerinus]MBS1021518.1 hypothetical protein [Gluconobacter cerinus]